MSGRNTGQKKRSRTPLVIGTVAVLVIALGAIALMAVGNRKTGSSISVSTTPIVTPSVSQSLEAFRGKVVILDLWATWCPPCRAEIPDFITLQNKYRDQGLEIIGVSVDPIDPRGGGGARAVAPFMQQYKINYHIWMVNDWTALTGYPMGQGIPTTYVIDRQGRITKTHVGQRPLSVFESDVKELL